MAMMDKKSFLLSHIRNSFITSDDTGMSEVVIECDGDYIEDGPKRERKISKLREKQLAEQSRELAEQYNQESRQATKESTETDEQSEEPTEQISDRDANVVLDIELPHSYDIMQDMDLVGHRRRSYTAQRLDKIKRDREERSKVQRVQWKDSATNSSHGDDVDNVFEKRVINSQRNSAARKSALSSQLAQVDVTPNNPFSEFAKFNGKSSSGVAVKTLAIFLTMAGESDRPYPMTVVTVSSARILQLIGLICWQYTEDGRLPMLQDSVNYYALHIAEDDGEVDMDFPALDINEPISKFGFAKLALVEREMPVTRRMSSMVVTINMPGRGFSRIPIENETILMKELLTKVLERRKIQDQGVPYRLEKQKEPGEPVDLEKPLSAMTTLDFVLIRENSVRADLQADEGEAKEDDVYASLYSPQYKSFNVTMIQKVGRNVDIQLGISGEKIEIDPIGKGQGIFKAKATSLEFTTISFCHTLEKEKRLSSSSKSADKQAFRIVYRTPKNEEHEDETDKTKEGSDFDLFHYHNIDFEASSALVKEIVTKVDNILELRFSLRKREYEKKMKIQKDIASKAQSLKPAAAKQRRNTFTFGAVRKSLKHKPFS